MGPAAAAGTTSTVEPTAPTCWGKTVESAASTNWSAAAESAVKPDSAASIEGRPATIKTGATPVESTATIVTMEPWARADKRAPDEIARAVITIGRTRVRGIFVVAVGADRRRPDVRRPTIDWPYSNSDSKPDLRVGCSRPRNRHQKPKHHRVL